jgi:predicted PurR-regulated permease PerM
MAKKPKSTGPSFTTLRIIGEKAHKLLQRAKDARAARQQPAEPALPVSSEASLPSVTIHLSLLRVVQATFAIIGILLGVLLLFLLQDKIVLMLLAVFVAAVVDPGAKALAKIGIPRGLAILFLYFVALFLLVSLLVSLIPILADQIQQIAAFINEQVSAFLASPSVHLPFVSDEVNGRLTNLVISTINTLSISQITGALQELGKSLAVPAEGSLLFAAHVAGSVVNFIVNLILVLVIAFFMQLEKEKIIAWLRGFVPGNVRSYVEDKSEVIHWQLGQWVRGQLLLCAAIGILVFLALVILRMPYALTLGILAFFTEFIPVVGIFVAAIPAVLIALTQQGFLWAVMLACIYYVIQWCESNLLAPLILKRTVGLSPIAILFAMLVGISFPSVIHPILGIMLAIPLTTIIALFLEDWRELRMRLRK